MSFAPNDEGPLIYVITDGTATSETFPAAAQRISRQLREAVEEKVSMFQIREKKLCGRHLFELSAACSRITRGSNTKLLINDRVDIAIGAGADGVHLTSHSIPTEAVRKAFGNELLIGRSIHEIKEAEASSKSGSDFVVLGPIFETPGKSRSVGIDDLKRLCLKLSPFPVIGLGGIDSSNCTDVILAGAAGVAGIRNFASPDCIRSLRKSLQNVASK